MNDILKDALNWWNSLTEHGRAQFPTPNSNEDILNYYNDPAVYSLPPNINY